MIFNSLVFFVRHLVFEILSIMCMDDCITSVTLGRCVTHRMFAKLTISQKLTVAQKKSWTKKTLSDQSGYFLKIWPLLNNFFLKRGHIFKKDAHCSENDFIVHEFFFVRLLVFEIWSILYMVNFASKKIEHISKAKSS